MNGLLLAGVFLLHFSPSGAAPHRGEPVKPAEGGPAWLGLVVEMKPIAELDSWKPCREDALIQEVALAKTALKAKLRWCRINVAVMPGFF